MKIIVPVPGDQEAEVEAFVHAPATVQTSEPKAM